MIHQKSLKYVVDYIELDREISSVFHINITGLCLTGRCYVVAK